MSLQKLTKRTN